MIKMVVDKIDLVVHKEWIREERNWMDKDQLGYYHNRVDIRQ